MSIFNINIRSFFKNKSATEEFFSSLSHYPDILACCETWLNEEDVEFANFEGYNSYHTLRDGRSGGVSVFCVANLKSRKIVDLSPSTEHIEACCVEVVVGGQVFYVLSIYRPHSGSPTEFNSVLDFLLHNPALNGKKVCITGDLNINLLYTVR